MSKSQDRKREEAAARKAAYDLLSLEEKLERAKKAAGGKETKQIQKLKKQLEYQHAQEDS